VVDFTAWPFYPQGNGAPLPIGGCTAPRTGLDAVNIPCTNLHLSKHKNEIGHSSCHTKSSVNKVTLLLRNLQSLLTGTCILPKRPISITLCAQKVFTDLRKGVHSKQFNRRNYINRAKSTICSIYRELKYLKHQNELTELKDPFELEELLDFAIISAGVNSQTPRITPIDADCYIMIITMITIDHDDLRRRRRTQ
jgi:hypothetical protein